MNTLFALFILALTPGAVRAAQYDVPSQDGIHYTLYSESMHEGSSGKSDRFKQHMPYGMCPDASPSSSEFGFALGCANYGLKSFANDLALIPSGVANLVTPKVSWKAYFSDSVSWQADTEQCAKSQLEIFQNWAANVGQSGYNLGRLKSQGLISVQIRAISIDQVDFNSAEEINFSVHFATIKTVTSKNLAARVRYWRNDREGHQLEIFTYSKSTKEGMKCIPADDAIFDAALQAGPQY